MAGSSENNVVDVTTCYSLVTGVKNERDEAEINAMASKMKKKIKKIAPSATSELKPLSTAGNVNRIRRPVPVLTEISSPDSMDVISIKRRFGWHTIGCYNLPYIIRLINCEEVKFASVRMAEAQLLINYLHYLHTDIYNTCTSVTSYYITVGEAAILNDINLNHCDKMYGKDKFVTGKDCIVKLEDVLAFYLFIEVCYKRLISNYTPGRHEKCGFIRINSEFVVAYCTKDYKKYIPLFYFEGETDDLQTQAIRFENWDLAYLKFCCKVQCIRDELFATDSCLVTSLENVKSYFLPGTNFEDYWPARVFDKALLINQNLSRVNPSGSWIQTPTLGLNTADNEHHPPLPTLLPPAAVPLSSMPMGMNSYQNGWPSNQLNSTMLQQSNSNDNQMNIQPPPVPSGIAITTQSVSNHTPYPINQSMTTMPNNSMANGNYLILQQFVGVQQQQQQLQQQQQQQQSYQQIIVMTERGRVVSSNPCIGKTERKSVVRSSPRIGNTQQRNALWRTTVTPPTSEIIDLSSPPSSPEPSAGPSSSSDTVIRRPVVLKLQRIPECSWQPETSNYVAYKIQRTYFQGKYIRCINAVAFNYSELLVTLEDLVQTMFPSVTVKRCAEVLTKYLNVKLYIGNSDQMAVIRENNRRRHSDDTRMAMVNDVNAIFRHLIGLIHKPDEDIQQFSLGSPAKIRRNI